MAPTERDYDEGVKNTATFHLPINAMARGSRPVKVIATGDQPGKSPVFLTVDGKGEARWESQRDVTIIDLNFLPATTDQVADLLHSRR